MVGRVTGIGGIFFKSKNAEALRSWYEEHLGIENKKHGTKFSAADPFTVWSIFPESSTYFGEGSLQSFMLNYVVDDLDAVLERLAKADVKIDPKREDASYGRFAWIYDPDGNKIELWQPAKANQ